MKTTTSGDAAPMSAHETRTDGVPRLASRADPPAVSIISGTQWPPLNGGSDHSSANVRASLSPRHGVGHHLEPVVECLDEGRRRGLGPRHGANPEEAVENLAERARVHRENLGATTEQLECFVDVTRGHGTHRTQVLGEHEIGAKLTDRIGVEAIDRCTPVDARAHQTVHLGRFGRRRQRREGDGSLGAGLRGPVAFVGDPHEVRFETQGEGDLGGRRQQGEDPHAAIVPHAGARR